MVYKISPLDNFLQKLWGITEHVSSFVGKLLLCLLQSASTTK